MINITDKRARVFWQQEMDRQMQVLERPYIRKLTPLLNKQFRDAAEYVMHGMLDSTDFAVDKRQKEHLALLKEHYKRVATVFGKKSYKIIESGKFVSPPELKAPVDEYWKEINRWSETEAATKIRRIQKTTKGKIASIIKTGMGEQESHRDIAKRITKTSYSINPFRAQTIALTETHTASVRAVDTAVKSTRIEMEREWVSAHDMRTRTRGKGNIFEHLKAFPNGPDGERTSQDGKFTGTGEALSYPGDPSGSPGNVIRCLTSYKTPIFTSNGWKRAKDVAIGDLVLTHRNRFRKVLRLNQSIYGGEVTTISLEGQGYSITVTPEHPFLITDGKNLRSARWKKAKDITEKDYVRFMASYCEYCGNPIPYYLKYCDRSCEGKNITDRQWKDPKYRVNMSKKASAQMKREYENGTRDRFEITKGMRKAHIKKWGPGGSLKVLTKTKKFQDARLRAIEKKYGSVLDMLKQKAFPALGRVNYGKSKIEQAMASFLDKNNRNFIPQFPVGRRRVDFYVKNEKLFIEVDGYPWHEDKKGERKRDLEILTKYPDHKIAHVDYKPNPPKWEFFDLLSLNHSGTFSQVGVKVRNVTVRQLEEGIQTYNFAVEEDESYVAKGFVTHNCRCVVLYHSVRRTEPIKPYTPQEGFIPAANLEEAKERFGKEFRIFDLNSEGFAKGSNAPVKSFNVIGEDLSRMKSQFSRLSEKIDDMTPINDVTIFNISKGRFGSGGQYFNIQKRIEMPVKGVRTDVTLFVGRKGGNPSFIVSEDLAGKFRHEFAHHIQISMGREELTLKWNDIWKANNQAWWRKSVSQYAGTNMNEAFAECFSAYTSPKYKAGMLPKEIEEYFEKVLGKRKLPGVLKPVREVFGKISIGKPVKSAEEILEHYKASSKVTFIEGKSSAELKQGIEERLGRKMWSLRDKKTDEFMDSMLGFKREEEMSSIHYEMATKNLIRQWARTSGDTNPRSIMMQLAARAEFKLEEVSLWWEDKALEQAKKLFKTHEKAARQFLREMYKDTQEHLAKQGLKTVRVARGYVGDIGIDVSTPEKLMEKVKIELQPISSFSSDIDTAISFTKNGKSGEPVGLFFADIPVDRILSTPITGYGCMSEFEFVVLGSRKQTEQALISVVKRTNENPYPYSALFGTLTEGKVVKIMKTIFEATK